MRYFTPDLLSRSRAVDDAIAEPAAEEWDRRGEEYRKHLNEIQPHLPRGVRRLLRHALHDAEVLTLAADNAPEFSIFLELESPLDQRDRHLELRYQLAGKGLSDLPQEKWTRS